MVETAIKWIWHFVLIIIVVVAVFAFYSIAFNKKIDTAALESHLLKDRIEFSLKNYGDLSDCIIPEKYAVNITMEDKRYMINEKNYLKEVCTFESHYCREFEFDVNKIKVRMDVIFARE